MKPTLFLLAAGMGSRYGGLKQLDGTKLQNNTEEKSYIPFKFEHKSIISLLLTQIKPYF